jgi:hypothetical protein
MDISILQIQSSSVRETAYYVEILCRLKLIDEVEETDFCSLFDVGLTISNIHVLPSQLPLPTLLTSACQ